MPYILDYTPSGAHFLFQNLLGYSTSEELQIMWDLEKAANHAQKFSGFIPCSNETLIDFIHEYKFTFRG